MKINNSKVQAGIQEGDNLIYGDNKWLVTDVSHPGQIEVQLLTGPIKAVECIKLPILEEPMIMRGEDLLTISYKAEEFPFHVSISIDKNKTSFDYVIEALQNSHFGEFRNKTYVVGPRGISSFSFDTTVLSTGVSDAHVELFEAISEISPGIVWISIMTPEMKALREHGETVRRKRNVSDEKEAFYVGELGKPTGEIFEMKPIFYTDTNGKDLSAHDLVAMSAFMTELNFLENKYNVGLSDDMVSLVKLKKQKRMWNCSGDKDVFSRETDDEYYKRAGKYE